MHRLGENYMNFTLSIINKFKRKLNICLPAIIRYIIKHPILVSTTAIWAAIAPTGPNDSLITPAYVVVSPARVNLIRNSTEISARNAITRISTKAGITPRTFKVAGRDIMPAPIMLLATLKTAPETVAGGTPPLESGRRGTRAPATGDISDDKCSD